MIFLYADPDATGTGDGLSWINAKTTLQGAYDLIPSSLSDDYTILCRASSGSAFTGLLDMSVRTMNGFTTTLQAEEGDQAVKTGWDTTRARIEASTPVQGLIMVNCPNVNIVGLQIYNFSSNGYGISLFSTDTLIDGVRIRSFSGGNGINCNTAVTAKIQNFIMCFFDGSTAGSEGVYVGPGASGLIELYNGVIYGYDDGVEDDSVGDIVNCVNLGVINSVAQDFDSVANVNYCLSDDGSGTNAQTPLGGDHLNEFVDPVNEDFTAVETGNIQFGIGVSLDANVPLFDMEGDPRSGATAYIGADEPSSGTTPAIPNDLILSEIILEPTTANKTAIPSNLILSAIILESTTGEIVKTAIPIDLVLSSIILESTTALKTAFPIDLVLSEIILESPSGDIVKSAMPVNLVLSKIILESTTALKTAIPNDLVLSEIILETTKALKTAIPDNLTLSMIVLEQTSGNISGVANPNDLILSEIILNTTTGKITGSAIPLDLVLSEIILGKTKQSGSAPIPACLTINMSVATIDIETKTAEITINMEVC